VTILRRLAEQGDLRWNLLILVAVSVTRIPGLFSSFLSEDEAIYSALASRLLAGFAPYTGAVDHKPPGIVLWYALVYALVGRNHLVAVRASLIAVVAVTSLVVGRIAVLRSGHTSARMAGLIYGIASASLAFPTEAQAANTELFAALPLSLAALATLYGGTRRLVMAGALVALATLFRYPSGLVGVALATFVMASGVRQKSTPWQIAVALGALASGFLAVAAIFWATLHHFRSVDAFFFWGWKYNFTYLNMLTTFETLRNALEHSAEAALWWIPLWLLLRPPRHLFEWTWIGAAGLGLLPGGRFFGHYYLTLLPPLCLLLDKHRLTRSRIALWSGTASIVLVLSLSWNGFKPRITEDQSTCKAVGAAVTSRTGREERVFVWGTSPEIYHYADRVMATRFAFGNYHTGRIWGSRYVDVNAVGTERWIVPRAWRELLADLEATPPALIVDGGAGRLNRWDRHPIARYPELAHWVSTRYRIDQVVAGVPIYVRK
jgi:hypothetical protein